MIFAALFCSMIIFVFLRLLYLQVHEANRLAMQSVNNCTRKRSVEFPRGNIVDCNGILLATNRPVVNIAWQGTGNKQLTQSQRETIGIIEQLSGQALTDKQLAAISRAERMATTTIVATDISFDTLTKIVERLSSCLNIAIKSHFERYYPYKDLASHLIGYLGKMDLSLVGKMGVERLSQQQLKGIEGVQQALINAVGKELAASIIQEGQSGQTIHTTIDLELQQLAQTVFGQEFTGTMVIMDCTNGALRALVSRPTFDPSIFLQQLDQRQWQELQEGRPFVNRALTACYPPASLFKIVTLSAALETGLITPATKCFCPGYCMFAQRKYHCRRKEGHGLLTLKEALAYSCNIIFFEIGKHISIDTIADYAGKFGLGKPTGIALEEKIGLIPSSAWKLRTKGERWWPGETLSATIGQSYMLVTPMQMARMYAGLHVGYLTNPRLLEHEDVVQQPLALQDSTRKFLLNSLRAVIQQGSGRRINTIKEMTVYAKTGTAQTSALGKQELGKKYVEHGWFVAMFEYHDQPPLAMVIMAEHAGCSSVATGVAKRFLLEYKKIVDKRIAQNSLRITD